MKWKHIIHQVSCHHGSYGFAAKGVLNIRECPHRVDERGSARENSTSAFGRIQHLLNIRYHACNVGRDKRVLNTGCEHTKDTGRRKVRTLVFKADAVR